MERRRPGIDKLKAGVSEAFRAVKNSLSPKKRYVIEVDDDFNALMGQIAGRRGISREQIIPRALASYVVLQRELKPDEENAEKHLVIRNDQEILQRVNLP
jgi:hypothetical protein